MIPLKIWFLRKTNSWTCQISNSCCCFLQARAVKKIKTSIRNATPPNQ